VNTKNKRKRPIKQIVVDQNDVSVGGDEPRMCVNFEHALVVARKEGMARYIKDGLERMVTADGKDSEIWDITEPLKIVIRESRHN